MTTKATRRKRIITTVLILLALTLYSLSLYPTISDTQNDRLRPVVVDYASLEADQDWFKSESVEVTQTFGKIYPAFQDFVSYAVVVDAFFADDINYLYYEGIYKDDGSYFDIRAYNDPSGDYSGWHRITFFLEAHSTGILTFEVQGRVYYTPGSAYNQWNIDTTGSINDEHLGSDGRLQAMILGQWSGSGGSQICEGYFYVWDYDANDWDQFGFGEDSTLTYANFEDSRILIDELRFIPDAITDDIRTETRYTTTADQALKRAAIPLTSDLRPSSITVNYPEQWTYSHIDPNIDNVTDSGNSITINDIPSGLNEILVYWTAPDNIGYCLTEQEIGRYSFEVAPTSIGDASSDDGLEYEIVAEGGASFHLVHDATENQSYSIPLNIEGHFYGTILIRSDLAGQYSGDDYALNISYWDGSQWRPCNKLKIRGGGNINGYGTVELDDSDDAERWEAFAFISLYTTPNAEPAQHDQGWNIWVQVMDQGAGWTDDLYLDLMVFYNLDYCQNQRTNNIKGRIMEINPYGFFPYSNGPFEMQVNTIPTPQYETKNTTDSDGYFLIKNSSVAVGTAADFRIWVPDTSGTMLNPISTMRGHNLTFTSAALNYYSRDYYRLEVTGEAYSDTLYNISIEGEWTALVREGDLIAINDTVGDHTFEIYSKARPIQNGASVFYWTETSYSGIYTVDASTRIIPDTTGGGTTYTFSDMIGTGAGYILVASIVGFVGLVYYNERKRR